MFLRRLGHDIERVERKHARNRSIYTLVGIDPGAEERLVQSLDASVATFELIGKTDPAADANPLTPLSAAIVKALEKGKKRTRELQQIASSLGYGDYNGCMSNIYANGYEIKRTVNISPASKIAQDSLKALRSGSKTSVELKKIARRCGPNIRHLRLSLIHI